MKRLGFLCIALFLPFSWAWSADLTDGTAFSDYLSNVDLYCKNPNMPWNKDDLSFWKITVDYAPFSPELLKNTQSKLISTETDAGEKSRIEASLRAIGTYEWYRALEVARITYQTNMNRIFSCAVVSSRYEKINKLIEIIKKVFSWEKSSDILKKIEKERLRYDRLRTTMNCGLNSDDSSSYRIMDRLSASATTEYCNYLYYTDYLRAQLENNASETSRIDVALAEKSGPQSTTDRALSVLSSRQQSIEQDLARATDTLPKALVAYREMERTYALHLVLVLIYDDYLKLRDNIDLYLSAVSQLFEKAFNAQDKNNR